MSEEEHPYLHEYKQWVLKAGGDSPGYFLDIGAFTPEYLDDDDTACPIILGISEDIESPDPPLTGLTGTVYCRALLRRTEAEAIYEHLGRLLKGLP